MKLQIKLALVVGVGILLTIGLLIGLIFAFSKIFLHGYTHIDLQEISLQVTERLSGMDDLSPSAVRSVLDGLADQHEDVQMELFTQDGTLVYSSEGRTEGYAFLELMNRFVDQPYNLFTRNDVTMLYEVPTEGDVYFLALSVKGEALSDVQVFMYFNEYSALPFMFIPLLLIILLPTLLVIAFVVTVNRRIRRLNLAMRQVDLGALTPDWVDRSQDEIGELVRQFRAMSEKLQSQFARIQQVEEARKMLVSNLSHDLRTPLTSIRGYAETLQRGKIQNRWDVSRYSTIILQQSQYMDHLLDQLFAISTLDRMGGLLEKKPCNICKLVQQIVADYVLILEDKQIEPDICIPDEAIWLEIDQWAIGQVIRNLIDNAVYYAGDARYLGIHLIETADVVLIEVRDRGKGIPPEESSKIFEPFYRIEKGRNSGGHGIGLTLALEIVKLHQGRIFFESKPYELTVFTVELPKRVTAVTESELIV